MKFFEKVPFEAKSLSDCDSEMFFCLETRWGILRRHGADTFLLRKNARRQKEIMRQIRSIEANTPNSVKREHRFLVFSRKWIFWGLIDWVVEDYIVAPNGRKALEMANEI